MIGNWESNLKLPPPPPPPPRKTAPRIGLRFRSRLGLVLGFGEGGGNQTIAPEEKCPLVRVKDWIRVSFGVGRKFSSGGNCPRTNLNKGNKTDIFMDLSKAFDTLDHSLWIANLEAYGFDSLSLEFEKNYLTKRKQRFKVGNCFSIWRYHKVPYLHPCFLTSSLMISFYLLKIQHLTIMLTAIVSSVFVKKQFMK